MAGRHGRGYLQVISNLEDRHQLGIQLVDITDSWITGYIDWMVRRGLLQSTIKKRVDAIRRTLQSATKRKQPVATLLDEPSIISTAINRADVGQSKQPLDFVELMRLVELTGLSKRHQTVLDEFLLMAFTSVRISDLMRSDSWIINNDSITLKQQKTKGIQSVTINEVSRRLIKKYGSVDIQGNYTLRLPVFTGQYFNREIKTIAKLAGITKPVSAHVGRHSYARLLSDLGLPEHIRAVELGHAAGSVTQGYGRQTDNNFVRIVVNTAMRKAFAAYQKKMNYEQWYFKINPYMNEINIEQTGTE
jgi:integrase